MTEPHNEWDEHAAGWDTDEAARTYAAEVAASLGRTLDSFAPLPGTTALGNTALGNTALGDTDLAGTRVIDFGCGTGLLTEHLVAGGADVVAIDTSPAMLAVLDQKIADRGWTSVRTAVDISGMTGGFDLVVCSSVCSFLDDYPEMVERLVDLLGPGGAFAQWDWERMGGSDGEGLTRNEISEALHGAGLTDVGVDTAFTVSMFGETMRPLIGRGRRPSA